MLTSDVTPDLLAASVIAVPPLARNSHRRISVAENTKIIRAIEAGGVTTLLYGGNAVFYHMRLTEFAEILSILSDAAAPNTWIVPSVGPTYGIMMDQAEILKDYHFPTVMILPQKEIADEAGIATGVRHFVEQYGKPIVLYLKHDRWLAPALVASLVRDGLVSWIKYAVVRENPSVDPYLTEILSIIPANIVVSGIGEQPAIIHLRDFGVGGFTSGCVCVSPARSMAMLRAIQAKDFVKAEAIRSSFVPLEDLRNKIQPIRVLHHAVAAAGIAETGPMQPLLGELTEPQQASIKQAVQTLIALPSA
ncbi:MAG TPA: dihydrodipicolinate synthase family protein [Pirellula sp.]|nr:dihydrodipicolinate synthase family protein [Pirellula sp.]